MRTEKNSPVASAASDGAITDQSDGQAATLPADPTSGITDTIDGETIGLGIPDAQDASDAEDISNATAIYSGGAPDTAIAAQADTDGVSEDITITGTDAPTTYDFPLDLPAGVSLQAEPNGSYAIVQDLADGTSEQIGQIEAPWATDANGNPVPTSYTLDGNTLIQTIDFTDSTAFPVVADPSLTKFATCILEGIVPVGVFGNLVRSGAATEIVNAIVHANFSEALEWIKVFGRFDPADFVATATWTLGVCTFHEFI